MNYIELKKVTEELLKIIKKYYKGDINDKIIIGFLSEILILINEKNSIPRVELKLKQKLKSLFPPHEGLSDYYVYIENNNSEMYNINQKVKNLKKKLWFLIIE